MCICHVMLRTSPVLCNGEGSSVDGLTTYDGGNWKTNVRVADVLDGVLGEYTFNHSYVSAEGGKVESETRRWIN